MSSKILHALCAAMLLAACDTTADKPATQPPQLANSEPTIGPTVDRFPEGPSIGHGIGNTVYFDTDSASLTADSQALLQQQAAWLLQNRQRVVTIEGHADERGTREYNLALGERRAEAVMNYLSALGVDAARLSEISYGKERPICPDATETCWEQNRRSVTALEN
jgi:peptidoglycan-associated lipoprotein